MIRSRAANAQNSSGASWCIDASAGRISGPLPAGHNLRIGRAKECAHVLSAHHVVNAHATAVDLADCIQDTLIRPLPTRGPPGGHLPAALTTEWFFQAFTDLDIDTPAGQAVLVRTEENADDFEAVWSQLSKFNLYDPSALLAAIPRASEHLLTEAVMPDTQCDVRIIDKDSVMESELVKDLMSGLVIKTTSSRIMTDRVITDSVSPATC